MELIAITTFLTFANITGVVAATEVLDQYEVEREGVVIIEELAYNEEPKSLLEAIQQRVQQK